MVRLCYQGIANSYQEVKAAACGRQACSVMIMVAYEVDAMASCKMLTQLLRSDNIGYTIRPVLNFDEVIYNYQSFMTEDIKTIFMINCGALYNIPKMFDLETGGDVRCFILDNHRPIHLANLYSRHSVVVFDDTFDPYDDDGDQNIPCDGSDLSGGLSSSDDDSASTTSTGGLDEEDLFDEELQEADIHAAFGRDGDEEAELEDEDAGVQEDGESSQAEEAEGSNAESGAESEGEGEDLGSDEERSVDEEGEGESEDSASTDAGEEADVEEGEADVTVEYGEGEDPSRSGKRKHRGVSEHKRGSKKQRPSRARGGTEAEGEEGDEAGLSDSDESASGTRRRSKGKKGTTASAKQGSSRASYPIGAAEGDDEGEGEGVHDVTAEEGWAAAEAQRSHRRRTADLARGVSSPALSDAEEGERDPMYDQDDVEEGEGETKGADYGDEDEEDRVQIRGRKRREAEEVVRARERRHELQTYYSQNARYTAPTALMLIELLSAQLGSRQMPTEVLWQAVLGVTYQYTAGHLPELLYSDYCSFLKGQFGDALRSGGERNQYAIRANEDSAAQNNGGAAGQTLLPEDGDMMLVPGSENGYVEEASEYRFFLYRHWSLYDAMYHSPYVASKLGVWNPQGTVKLQELLARMGVPLNQCRQSYQYMAPSLRSHFTQQISDETILEAYGFTNPGVTFKSFYRYNSFKNPVAASDIVHAATALVEMYGAAAYSSSLTASAVITAGADSATLGDSAVQGQAEGAMSTAVVTTASAAHKVTSTEAFYEAYSCLGMRSDEALQKGIQAALDLQRTLVKKASAMMDGNASIHRCHRLYYAYLSRSSSSWGPASGALGGAGVGAGGVTVHRGAHGMGDTCSTPVEHTFGRPLVLAKLGQYIMDIKRNVPKKNGGWQGSALLPFVLLSEKADGNYIVVGISPLASLAGGEELTAEQQNKLYPLTNFKQFFKLAGQLLGAQVRSISFDANVVEVRKADVQEFLGALDDSLRKATPRFNTTGAGAVTA